MTMNKKKYLVFFGGRGTVGNIIRKPSGEYALSIYDLNTNSVIYEMRLTRDDLIYIYDGLQKVIYRHDWRAIREFSRSYERFPRGGGNAL